MAKKCVYETCVRVASGRDKNGKPKLDCGPCRARYRYWNNKTPADRLERRRMLELSGETMREFVADRPLLANVKVQYKKEVKANAKA